MAKLSYVISKNVKRSGKSGFHFDGSGSGNWFQRWFSASKESRSEISPEKAEIKDLISKLVTEFDGNSESVRETRFEVEGSADEIKEFAAWSVSEIKANAESLKFAAEFIKDYCQSLGKMCVDMWKGFNEADHIEAERDKLQSTLSTVNGDVENLKVRVDNLEEAAKKSGK